MDNTPRLNDILLRRFKLKYYDTKRNCISHEAFSPSDDDRLNGCRLSANCLRILIEVMKVNPSKYTLASKSPEEYSIISIDVESVNNCKTVSGNLNVISDPVSKNEAHCLICGYPVSASRTERRNVRRALAMKSFLYDDL